MPAKYGHIPYDWFERFLDKFGGEEEADRFLQDDIVISKSVRPWKERHNILYFNVMFDGTTGEDWITRLEEGSFNLSPLAKRVLASRSRRPTRNSLLANVVVIKGAFFPSEERTIRYVRDVAEVTSASIPNLDLACLIREKFTDTDLEAMGLERILVMHRPRILGNKGVKTSPLLLEIGKGNVLDVYDGTDTQVQDASVGFAFLKVE